MDNRSLMINYNDVLILEECDEVALVLVVGADLMINNEMGLEIQREDDPQSKELISKHWFLNKDNYQAINLGSL